MNEVTEPFTPSPAEIAATIEVTEGERDWLRVGASLLDEHPAT